MTISPREWGQGSEDIDPLSLGQKPQHTHTAMHAIISVMKVLREEMKRYGEIKSTQTDMAGRAFQLLSDNKMQFVHQSEGVKKHMIGLVTGLCQGFALISSPSPHPLAPSSNNHSIPAPRNDSLEGDVGEKEDTVVYMDEDSALEEAMNRAQRETDDPLTPSQHPPTPPRPEGEGGGRSDPLGHILMKRKINVCEEEEEEDSFPSHANKYSESTDTGEEELEENYQLSQVELFASEADIKEDNGGGTPLRDEGRHTPLIDVETVKRRAKTDRRVHEDEDPLEGGSTTGLKGYRERRAAQRRATTAPPRLAYTRPPPTPHHPLHGPVHTASYQPRADHQLLAREINIVITSLISSIFNHLAEKPTDVGILDHPRECPGCISYDYAVSALIGLLTGHGAWLDPSLLIPPYHAFNEAYKAFAIHSTQHRLLADAEHAGETITHTSEPMQ